MIVAECFVIITPPSVIVQTVIIKCVLTITLGTHSKGPKTWNSSCPDPPQVRIGSGVLSNISCYVGVSGFEISNQMAEYE